MFTRNETSNTEALRLLCGYIETGYLRGIREFFDHHHNFIENLTLYQLRLIASSLFELEMGKVVQGYGYSDGGYKNISEDYWGIRKAPKKERQEIKELLQSNGYKEEQPVVPSIPKADTLPNKTSTTLFSPLEKSSSFTVTKTDKLLFILDQLIRLDFISEKLRDDIYISDRLNIIEITQIIFSKKINFKQIQELSDELEVKGLGCCAYEALVAENSINIPKKIDELKNWLEEFESGLNNGNNNRVQSHKFH